MMGREDGDEVEGGVWGYLSESMGQLECDLA